MVSFIPQPDEITPERIAESVCPDLIRDVGKRHDRTFLVTPFLYPDRDGVVVYVDRKGGDWFLSDRGTSAFKHFIAETELRAENRVDEIKSICALFDVEYDDRTLRRRVSMTTAGHDLVMFCQAVMSYSRIGLGIGNRSRRHFDTIIEDLLESRIGEKRSVERGWYDPSISPDGSYKFDFHVNSVGRPRNLFSISSPMKAEIAASTNNYYRSKGANMPAMAIVSPDAKIGRSHLSRLQHAVDQIRFDVEGNEDGIVHFSLATD